MKKKTCVQCTIPRLNLGSGKYLLSVSIAGKQTGLLDSLPCVAVIDIISQDVYCNGEQYLPIYGPILSEQRGHRARIEGSRYDEHGPLQFTGERLIPDDAGSRDIFWEHICRYQFACRFAANRRVLDIACGEGYGSAALLKSGASVIGIDVAEEACRHAARKYGISTMVGDAGKIPLPDDSIDLLVSFETVEHVPEPSVFLSECFRVMAPGALLIMSTPNKPAYQRHCASNEFHCSEMNEQQFASLLNDTFGSSEMYGQCIEWIGWRSPRVLAANNSTWMRITGLRFLKRLIEEHFCPHLSRRALPGYKKDPVGAIMKETTRADLLFNPYLVRPRKAAEREVTIYLIGMARKGAASDAAATAKSRNAKGQRHHSSL